MKNSFIVFIILFTLFPHKRTSNDLKQINQEDGNKLDNINAEEVILNLANEMINYSKTAQNLFREIVFKKSEIAAENVNIINKFLKISRTKNVILNEFINSMILIDGAELKISDLIENRKIFRGANNKINFDEQRERIIKMAKENFNYEEVFISTIFYKFLSKLIIYNKVLDHEEINDLIEIPDELLYYQGCMLDLNYLNDFKNKMLRFTDLKKKTNKKKKK